MVLDPSKLTKVEFSSIPKGEKLEGRLTAIVKVRKNHVPRNVTIRGRISPEMMTCEFDAAELANLEKDNKVISISIARPLCKEDFNK